MTELKDMCYIARKNLGLMQNGFAKKINSNQTEVSFIERGFIPEDAEKIKAIKELYNQINFKED